MRHRHQLCFQSFHLRLPSREAPSTLPESALGTANPERWGPPDEVARVSISTSNKAPGSHRRCLSHTHVCPCHRCCRPAVHQGSTSHTRLLQTGWHTAANGLRTADLAPGSGQVLITMNSNSCIFFSYELCFWCVQEILA